MKTPSLILGLAVVSLLSSPPAYAWVKHSCEFSVGTSEMVLDARLLEKEERENCKSNKCEIVDRIAFRRCLDVEQQRYFHECGKLWHGQQFKFQRDLCSRTLKRNSGGKN